LFYKHNAVNESQWEAEPTTIHTTHQPTAKNFCNKKISLVLDTYVQIMSPCNITHASVVFQSLELPAAIYRCLNLYL